MTVEHTKDIMVAMAMDTVDQAHETDTQEAPHLETEDPHLRMVKYKQDIHTTKLAPLLTTVLLRSV